MFWCAWCEASGGFARTAASAWAYSDRKVMGCNFERYRNANFCYFIKSIRKGQNETYSHCTRRVQKERLVWSPPIVTLQLVPSRNTLKPRASQSAVNAFLPPKYPQKDKREAYSELKVEKENSIKILSLSGWWPAQESMPTRSKFDRQLDKPMLFNVNLVSPVLLPTIFFWFFKPQCIPDGCSDWLRQKYTLRNHLRE